ncbi:transposase [Micromonospora sp. NPDC049274]|uniref:transposase n=1 Tax=Micromonospora sp. NPDC049274 TaxID=3154829 RepID=UPI0034410EC5
MAIKNVGADTGGRLLVAAGDNPERLHHESAFAHLCGVAPIPFFSGMTNQHRLNRGGNLHANRALYVLALGRLSYDERTADTWSGAPPKAGPNGRSSAAASATALARSSGS